MTEPPLYTTQSGTSIYLDPPGILGNQYYRTERNGEIKTGLTKKEVERIIKKERLTEPPKYIIE